MTYNTNYLLKIDSELQQSELVNVLVLATHKQGENFEGIVRNTAKSVFVYCKVK